jgi:hypothetical protein
MTHNYTYSELYKAADKLWPGEAENILADPTDEQLALILAVLSSLPVEGWAVYNGGTSSFTNATLSLQAT